MSGLELEHFLRLTTAASVAFVLLGLVLAVVAWRGVRRGTPLCRRCGYEVQGIERSRPCPECGRPLSRRFAVRRRTSRRLWLIGLGALLLLVAGGVVLGARGKQELARAEWRRHAPEWLLRAEARRGGDERTMAARAELAARWRRGEIGPESLVALVERGPREWDVAVGGTATDSWRYLVEELWEAGALTPATLERELERLVDPYATVELPAAVAPGDPVAIRWWIDPPQLVQRDAIWPHGRWRGWLRRVHLEGDLRLVVESGSVGGQSLTAARDPIVLPPMGVGFGIAGQAPPDGPGAERPGSGPDERWTDLRLVVRIEMGPPDRPWASWRRTLEREARIVSSTTPVAVTDEASAPTIIHDFLPEDIRAARGTRTLIVPSIRGARRFAATYDLRRQFVGGVDQVQAGTIGAAYEVFALHGSERRLIGVLRGDAARGARLEWRSDYPWVLWPDARSIDLELVPSAAVAETVPDIGRSWGATIRIEGVSIEPAD